LRGIVDADEGERSTNGGEEGRTQDAKMEGGERAEGVLASIRGGKKGAIKQEAHDGARVDEEGGANRDDGMAAEGRAHGILRKWGNLIP
jgi:hypothetical protein